MGGGAAAFDDDDFELVNPSDDTTSELHSDFIEIEASPKAAVVPSIFASLLEPYSAVEPASEAEPTFPSAPLPSPSPVEALPSFDDPMVAPPSPLPSTRAPVNNTIFNLIEVKSDQQDLSFVEKVILSQSDIFRLANVLSPGSVQASNGRWLLNPSSMDKLDLHTVGLYGNKQMILGVLVREGAISDSEVGRLSSSLAPGLYCVLSGKRLFLFYWHPTEKPSDARRNDISCNFIRYLLELSGLVYTCIEVEDGNVGISLKAGAASKANRTQRLQISMVTSSENDFKVRPGFKLRTELSPTTVHERVTLAEGFHRAAVMVPEKYTLKDQFRSETCNVPYDDIAKVVRSWGDVKLDLSQLNEQNLMMFAEASQLEGVEDVLEKLRFLDAKFKQGSQESYVVEDMVNQKRLQVLEILTEALNAYLRLRFPWEEGLYPNPNPEATAALSATGLRDFLEYNEVPRPGVRLDAQVLEDLGHEMVQVLSGKADDEMVFVSTVVTVDSGFRTPFTIIRCGSATTGPVMYNQVLVGETEKGQRFNMKIVGLGSRAGPVMLKDYFELEVQTGAGGKLLGFTWSSCTRVQFRIVERPENPVGRWLDSVAGDFIRGLRKKTCFAEFVIDEKRNLGLENADDESLAQSVFAECYEGLVPEEHFGRCLAKLEAISDDDLPGEMAKSLALKVYKSDRGKFLTTVFEFVEENVFRNLKAKVKSAKMEEKQAWMESIRAEKSQVIRKFVESLYRGNEEVPVVVVEGCNGGGGGALTRALNFVSGGRPNLRLRLKKQAKRTERIVWKAVELVPKKKDLDDLQAEKVITPVCSAQHRLVDLDSGSFELMKVILLKSGPVLVFVRNFEDGYISIFQFSGLGANASVPGKPPLKLIKRGTDLVAFDEESKFVAFYHKSAETVDVYRFDDSYQDLCWIGVSLVLRDYHGSSALTWMQFIPGGSEILVADEELVVRVLEVHPAMVKPGKIQLSGGVVRLCVSADGLCLIAIRGPAEVPSTEAEVEPVKEAEIPLSVDVYKLDDSLQHIRTVELQLAVESLGKFDVQVVMFGSQMQLVHYDMNRPGMLQSVLLDISVASQSCQLRRNRSKSDETTATQQVSSCHELDYLYHSFDKYAVSPPLTRASPREIDFGIILNVLRGNDAAGVGVTLVNQARAALEKLRTDKGKDFSNVNMSFDSQDYDLATLTIHYHECKLLDFLLQLMCLVPVQIARAENNSLKPLVDGLQMSGDVDYTDAVSLASVIRFGMYDAVLESWTGPVKVISSMGKQSSGKSYLLNHLSGSLLDVAGGRCTDGVWMTARVANACLYVILDFEGLGSFERSEQEDMLLSILNAAISNVTIFNKKDFHLDKETEKAFDRFQNGVSLVKQDDKLFRGLFYMAIKDVDAADVDELEDEFFSKIKQICTKSQDNFLTKMYGGNIEIAAMAPFNRSEFHENISHIAKTVEELDVVHNSGISFLRDLKLVISQISSKDWSPIDSKRIAFKVNLLRKHLDSAVVRGCLAGIEKKQLVNFDREEAILDAPLVVGDRIYDVQDTGLQLSSYSQVDDIGGVLDQLLVEFEKVVPRSGRGGVEDEEWHVTFEKFLVALAERRKLRVLQWLNVNTTEFASDGDVQKLVLESMTIVGELKESLALCNCKCGDCFLRCILEKSHRGMHSCNGTHRCSAACTYCEEQGDADKHRCCDVAGHEGSHDCRVKNHTCGKECDLFGSASNCNKSCTLKVAHKGEHLCNSRQHMCKVKCSLESCNNTCVSPLELMNHEIHVCHEKMCPEQCSIPGCNRKCATEDHFHKMVLGAVHLCGNEHPCPEECECRGNCEVITEVFRKTKTFVGKLSTFEYEHVSEQNGLRKGCCVPIPPFKTKHKGVHRHTLNTMAVHFCQVKCEGCGYFCNLPIGHPGLHDTTHGNMTKKTFASESPEVNIENRKYAWGESGVAEMCMMYCKAKGRGHIHLNLCQRGCVKYMDGLRHETRQYGPDHDVPKDELTHAAYWKNMRFKDPCSEEDQKQFALCPAACMSSDHTSSADQQKSYCTEKLWHPAMKKVASLSGTGYITEDGHRFECNHTRDLANHVIFVVDRSSSMATTDIVPSLRKFDNNRLGCVYEAMVRFVRTRMAAHLQDAMSVVLFNEHGTILLERECMSESLVDMLAGSYPSGCTTYSAGLQRVQEIVKRSLVDPHVVQKAPAVIFLSDGGNNGGSDPVQCVNILKSLEPRLVVHTIMFGNDPFKQVLEMMAKAGGGVFQVSLDELQLSKSFEGLAKSLLPKVASLV